jgi:hypothetical protein
MECYNVTCRCCPASVSFPVGALAADPIRPTEPHARRIQNRTTRVLPNPDNSCAYLRPKDVLRGPPSIRIFVVMRAATLKQPFLEIYVRAGVANDLDALVDLETKVFATDRMSRRSLRHFLSAPTAALLVAEFDSRITGSAVVLFRPNSAIARLYSIAVEPHCSGNGRGRCGTCPRLLVFAA